MLLVGWFFLEEMGDDYVKVIVNEVIVEFMGLEELIGYVIGLNEGSEIVGVVEDFYYGFIWNGIELFIFRCE